MDPFYDSAVISNTYSTDIIVVAGSDGPDIVVTGSVFWNGVLIYPDFEAWVNYEEWLSYQEPDVTEGADTEGDIVVTAPQDPSNPEASIDQLAQLIAIEIMAQSDPTIEYGAVIWRDADGVFHKTRVFPGEAGVWNIRAINPADHGFAWSQVVAIIHSHPGMYWNGAEWAPTSASSAVPSGGDLDGLRWIGQYGDQSQEARIYLLHQGVLTEYGLDGNEAAESNGGVTDATPGNVWGPDSGGAEP